MQINVTLQLKANLKKASKQSHLYSNTQQSCVYRSVSDFALQSIFLPSSTGKGRIRTYVEITSTE